MMRFGIVVTTEGFGGHISDLLSAAIDRGWACRCFLTDHGVRLLGYQPFRELARVKKVQVNVCEHSWEMFGKGSYPKEVQMSSQYQNAELAHECDKILVF